MFSEETTKSANINNIRKDNILAFKDFPYNGPFNGFVSSFNLDFYIGLYHTYALSPTRVLYCIKSIASFPRFPFQSFA